MGKCYLCEFIASLRVSKQRYSLVLKIPRGEEDLRYPINKKEFKFCPVCGEPIKRKEKKPWITK